MTKADLLFNGLTLTACSFIIACLSLFVIKCIEKWGVAEYWDIHIAGKKSIKKLWHGWRFELSHNFPSYCVWCFTFWVSLALTIILCVNTGHWSLMACVLLSTPISFSMYK